MTVRVLTDSTCDLPAEVTAALGITVIPLYVQVEGQEYLDGIDMTREEFYRRLPAFREQPRTAVPSPQKFRALYDSLAEVGADEILSVHISSSLSAVEDMARTAAGETTSARVTVLDSRQLSLGTGFLAATAARLAQAGSSVSAMLPALEAQIRRTHVFAALDTLQFLRRSGRMNAAVSTVGEVLQIKPLLKMYDGVSGAERVRTRMQAVQRLVELLREHAPYEQVALLHSAAKERASALLEEVRPLLPAGETWVEQINPVLGAHLGPGVIGFACVSQG